MFAQSSEIIVVALVNTAFEFRTCGNTLLFRWHRSILFLYPPPFPDGVGIREADYFNRDLRGKVYVSILSKFDGKLGNYIENWLDQFQTWFLHQEREEGASTCWWSWEDQYSDTDLWAWCLDNIAQPPLDDTCSVGNVRGFLSSHEGNVLIPRYGFSALAQIESSYARR